MPTIQYSGRRLVTACAIAVTAFTMTACGSDGSDSSSSTTGAASAGASDSAGIAAAKAAVDAHSKVPTSIGPTQKVGKPIPTGKKIVYINCGAQPCINVGNAMKEAAPVLGWSIKVINADPTPQSIQAAFTQALREKPDGVASMGYSKESYQRQISEFNAKKIPVLSATGVDPSGSGVDLQIIDPDAESDLTRLLADQTVVDNGGKGEVGIAFLTDYPVIKIYTDAYEAEVKEKCPSCTVKRLDVQSSSLGKDAAAKIANWLRANPKIGQVFLSLDDLGNGLSTAVRNAGGKMPKTYGQAPSATGLAALKSGERSAATPGPIPEVGWQFMDAFARSFTGQSMDPDQKWQTPILWKKSADNLPASADSAVVPGFRDQFKALWDK